MNQVKLLVLQHPQEPGKEIGTAAAACGLFPNSVLRTGLSWPNLSAALGAQADHKRWAVLYLGSARPHDLAREDESEIILVNRKGAPIERQREKRRAIEGLVVLDGTWSQAKALWWRNAWLLKLQRAVLAPERPSDYSKIRKEPRRECVSTLESAGIGLAAIEGRPELREQAYSQLKQFLAGRTERRPSDKRVSRAR